VRRLLSKNSSSKMPEVIKCNRRMCKMKISAQGESRADENVSLSRQILPLTKKNSILKQLSGSRNPTHVNVLLKRQQWDSFVFFVLYYNQPKIHQNGFANKYSWLLTKSCMDIGESWPSVIQKRWVIAIHECWEPKHVDLRQLLK
jgi:hypothetical protein